MAILAYIIDFMTYGILMFLSNNIILSNILAKIATSISGFHMHSKFTYKNNSSTNKSSVILYFTTVFLHTPISTSILVILNEFLHHYLAKILSDTFLFIIVYIFSTKFIFKKKFK